MRLVSIPNPLRGCNSDQAHSVNDAKKQKNAVSIMYLALATYKSVPGEGGRLFRS
jgi:hypothetical protein